MKISVILVSYNVKDYISQCIRSIKKSDLNNNEYEIIVVDNDSHDGSVDEIRNKFNDVILHENKTNEGFSKAVNKGVSLSKGDNICILNPDVIIQETTLSKILTKYESKPGLGAVGPKILNSDGSIQHSCKRSFPTPLNSLSRLLGLDRLFPKSKIFGKYNLTYLNIDKEHKVDVLSGAFMMIPKKVFDEIGGFDESFFMFGEDIDICHRIKDAGYTIYYSPLTEIIHYKGESVKSAPFDMINIFYSAMDLYFKKYSNKYKYWKFISPFVKLGLFLRKGFSYTKLFFKNLVPLFIDAIIILLSFSISIFFWYSYQYFEIVEFSKISYHYLLIVNFILSWLISSKIIGVYKPGLFSFTRIFLSILITFLISSTSTYFISFFAYSRGVLFISTILCFLIMILWRILIHSLYLNKIIFFQSFQTFIERRALMIGADNETYKIGQEINNYPDSDINIIGYTDSSNPLLFEEFLGRIDYIKEIITKNKINEIIIREDYFTSHKIFQIIKKLKGLNLLFKIIPEGNNIILSKGEIESISGIDLMSYNMPFLERSNIMIKRLFDITISLLLICATLPIQIFSCLFFGIRKERVWGLDEEYIKLNFININNNLISSIPLLYKVFDGKLSIVGSELINVKFKCPSHFLKPGLTSLVKTKKFRGNNTLRLDNYYIKNQSLIFDIEIILKSIFKS